MMPSGFSRSQRSYSPLTGALRRVATAWLLVGSTIVIAGAAMAQDHFRVYPVVPGEGLNGPIVQIDDQFGTQVTDLSQTLRFMVPASKNAWQIGPSTTSWTFRCIRCGRS